MNGVGENAGTTIGMADDLQLIRKKKACQWHSKKITFKSFIIITHYCMVNFHASTIKALQSRNKLHYMVWQKKTHGLEPSFSCTYHIWKMGRLKYQGQKLFQGESWSMDPRQGPSQPVAYPGPGSAWAIFCGGLVSLEAV